MSAREREHGELPSPNLSLFSRKVGQGHFVYGHRKGRPGSAGILAGVIRFLQKKAG